MSILTPIFNLFKLQKSEKYDIAQFNANMDIIDTEMAKPPLTVNEIEPDPETRNIDLRVVPLAENLASDKAQANTGNFIIRTSGGDTPISDGGAFLTDVRGNMVKTGYVAESITPSVSPDDGHLEISIDRETFVAEVDSSQTLTFTYTTDWDTDPTTYGITISGTPENGDVLTIVYVKENRGTITTANPTTFISTGWNLYNNAVGYCRVVNYSDEHGFMISGTYTGLSFAATLDAANPTPITPDASGQFFLPVGSTSGFLFVTGGNATDTAVWMQWSDWEEEPYQGTAKAGTFEAYTQTTIDLSAVMTNFPYGLMRIGNAFDEINLNAGYAYSRIDKLTCSAENLEYVIALGVPYDTDTGSIYYVRSEPMPYKITLSGDYTVSDHGTELFLGTSVPLGITTLYGQNLKDKLRMDVLTISAQTLTAAEQAQVQENIGINVANNLTTTDAGYVLDARQGKTLKDAIVPDAYTVTAYTADLNNLKTGTVYCSSSSANAPTAHNYYVMSFAYGNNSGFQIAWRAAGTTAFFRTKSSSGWTAWKQFATS